MLHDGTSVVAQYLAPGVIKFDLVIMDEASQLKPSIGAIARSPVVVNCGWLVIRSSTLDFVVLLPMNQDGDGGDDHFTTTDAESILDVCSSYFRPARLCAGITAHKASFVDRFSNHSSYRGNLVIFLHRMVRAASSVCVPSTWPTPSCENQTNLREAKRIVDAVAEHIATRPNDSLGIVTLNIKQRDLIAELLEERLRSVRGADLYRDH